MLGVESYEEGDVEVGGRWEREGEALRAVQTPLALLEHLHPPSSHWKGPVGLPWGTPSAPALVGVCVCRGARREA